MSEEMPRTDNTKPFKKRIKLTVETSNQLEPGDSRPPEQLFSHSAEKASTSLQNSFINSLSPNSIISLLSKTFGNADTPSEDIPKNTEDLPKDPGIPTGSQATVDNGIAEEQDSELDLLVIRDEDEQEILDLSKQIDCNLEQKAKEWNLSTINVKSILHHLIKNPQVLSLLGINMESLGSDDEETVQIRLTRRKAKELMETGKISWPLPMKEPVVASRTFLDVEYNNEDEDDDYDPSQEVEDPELEESEADDDSLTFSPLRPPTRRSLSLSSTPIAESASSPCGSTKSDDSVASMKPPRTPKVLKKMKLPDIPCLHTRSKESLKTVPIETLEEKLQSVDPEYPQDISNECYANLDPDYMEFLSGLTFDEPSVSAPEPPEEDDDPEWIFSEEKELDNDEVRSDRATKISKKEVEILLNDLFDIYNDNEDLQEESRNLSSENTQNISNSTSDIRVISPIPIPQTSETAVSHITEQHTTSCSTATSSTQSNPQSQKQWFLLTNALGPVLPIISVASPHDPSRTSNSSKLCQKLPIFSQGERVQLTHHLRKHVQLLMQTHLLTRTREDYKEEARSSFHMLLELEEQRKFKRKLGLANSAFEIINLVPAIETAERAVVEVPFKINKGIMPRKEVKKKTVQPLETRVMIELAASRGVLYPQLLPLADPIPVSRLNLVKPAYPFLPSEDKLLVLGLDEFSAFPSPERWELIAKHLLPVRSPKEIVVRRRTSRKSSKGGYNPVKAWMEEGVLPELSRDLEPISITSDIPLSWPSKLQPLWLQKVVELASNGRRPRKQDKPSPKRVFLQQNNLLHASPPKKPSIGRRLVPIAPKPSPGSRSAEKDSFHSVTENSIIKSSEARNCTNLNSRLILQSTPNVLPSVSDSSDLSSNHFPSPGPTIPTSLTASFPSSTSHPAGYPSLLDKSNVLYLHTPPKQQRMNLNKDVSPGTTCSARKKIKSPLKRAVDYLNDRDAIHNPKSRLTESSPSKLTFLSPKRRLEAAFRARQKYDSQTADNLTSAPEIMGVATTSNDVGNISSFIPYQELSQLSNCSFTEMFSSFAPATVVSTNCEIPGAVTIVPPVSVVFTSSLEAGPAVKQAPVSSSDSIKSTSESQNDEQKRKKRSKVQKTKDGIRSLLHAPTSSQVVSALCRAYFHDLQKALFMHESKLEKLMTRIMESEQSDNVEDLFPDLVGLLCSQPHPNSLLSRLLTLFLTSTQAEKHGCLKTRKNYALAWTTITKIERYLTSAKSKSFAKAVLRGMLEEGGNFGSDSSALKSYLKKTLSSEKYLLEEVMQLFPDEKYSQSVPDECFETIEDRDMDEMPDYEFETITDLPPQFLKSFNSQEESNPDFCSTCESKIPGERLQCKCKLPMFKFSGGAVLMLDDSGRYVAGKAVVSRLAAAGKEEEVVVIDGRHLAENSHLSHFMALVDDIERDGQKNNPSNDVDIVREAICAAFGSSRISFSPDKTASNSSIFLRGDEGKDLMLSAATNPLLSPSSSGVPREAEQMDHSPPISTINSLPETSRSDRSVISTEEWTAEEDRLLLILLQERKFVEEAVVEARAQLPKRSTDHIHERYKLLVQILDETE